MRAPLFLALLFGTLAAGCRKAPDDVDGDGYDVVVDCDDADATVHPDATERCNAVDDDCDGEVDEDAVDMRSWYADGDGDGIGDSTRIVEACEAPSSYVADYGDCDDADAEVHPDADEVCNGVDDDCDGSVDEDPIDPSTWYLDADGDGYGDGARSLEGCEAPSGYVSDATDCDDLDPDAHPSGVEVCDGVDNDCDGEVDEEAVDAPTWYLDADADGFGDASASQVGCAAPSGYVSDDSDCDDGDAAVHPGADERCDEGDDDCDGVVDEDDAVDAPVWYADTDGDGYGDAGVATTSCEQVSGYVADATDCDDSDGDVNPGAVEVCDGAVDEDCDGSVDEDDASDATTWYGDADGDGYGGTRFSHTSCEAPSASYVDDSSDCDDVDAEVHPGADEYCDGVDNDCDGDVDEDDALDVETWYLDDDGDGYGDADTSEAHCEAPSGYVSDSSDCDDGDADVHPGADEVCDDTDWDCDGYAYDGVLGRSADCPATDCAELLDEDPSAGDGSYYIGSGSTSCDMSTDGGGWTLVKDNAPVYGTTYTNTSYNSEGFTWSELFLEYDSGSVHAGGDYPGGMSSSSPYTLLILQLSSDTYWSRPGSVAGSSCGFTTNDYSSYATFSGDDIFVDMGTESTDAIRLATLEGRAGCTTSDNYGTAYVDLWVRRTP